MKNEFVFTNNERAHRVADALIREEYCVKVKMEQRGLSWITRITFSKDEEDQ